MEFLLVEKRDMLEGKWMDRYWAVMKVDMTDALKVDWSAE